MIESSVIAGVRGLNLRQYIRVANGQSRTPDWTDSRGRLSLQKRSGYNLALFGCEGAGSYNKKTCKEVLEGLETSFKKFPRFIN